jgi:HEAT repeat protein
MRSAVIQALAPLLEKHADLRATVTAKLDDESTSVRHAAIEALAPLLGKHAGLRAAVIAKLDDESTSICRAAIQILAPLLEKHADVRATIAAKLDDENAYVRSAAIEELAPLIGEDADLRAAITAKLDDENEYVRSAAIQALAHLLGRHADLRAAIAAKLNDAEWQVRDAAIQALAHLLGRHAELRAAVVAKLNDAKWDVRGAAIRALALLISEDKELRQRLTPALGIDDNQDRSRSRPGEMGPRGTLVTCFGLLATSDPPTRAEIIHLLNSPDWRMRQSAAEILAEAGKDCLLEALPQLLVALEDYRGTDSWPARIAAAELLLNNYRYSAEATETILPALDYGTHLLVIVPNAAEIRKQAALALGELKAEYRQPRVFDRLVRLLNEEQDPQVLDGAFNALLSLAAAPEGE